MEIKIASKDRSEEEKKFFLKDLKMGQAARLVVPHAQGAEDTIFTVLRWYNTIIGLEYEMATWNPSDPLEIQKPFPAGTKLTITLK